MTWFKS